MPKDIAVSGGDAGVPPAPSLAETMLTQATDPRRKVAAAAAPGPPLVDKLIGSADTKPRPRPVPSRLHSARPPLIESVARQAPPQPPAGPAKPRPILASLVSDAPPPPPRPAPLPAHSLVTASLRQFPAQPVSADFAQTGRGGAVPPSLAQTMLSQQQQLPPRPRPDPAAARMLVDQLPTEPPAPRAMVALAGASLVEAAQAPDPTLRRNRRLARWRPAAVAASLLVAVLIGAAWVLVGRLAPWRS
jgi:hypothetical protein